MATCLDCNIKLKEDEVERCNACLYNFIFEEELEEIQQVIKGGIDGESN